MTDTLRADPTSSLATVTKSIRKYLDDELVLEVRLNPDGSVWIDRAGEGKSLTDTRIDDPRDAIAFLRYVAT